MKQKSVKKVNKVTANPTFEKQIKRSKYIPIFILLAIIVVYLRVFLNQLTNWDDDLYILQNPYLKSFGPKNIAAIFATFFNGNYHPLSLICLAIGYKLGGVNAWPYQFINLSLHLCNTTLVYYFIKDLLVRTNKNSADPVFIASITALLFGIHTINVESVAWISENKNVLYTFFFLLSLRMYLKYTGSKQLKYFLFSILFFLMSLFSKGMAVSLTLSLFVIDFVLGRKLVSRKIIVEKIPFLALSVIFGVIAVFAQRSSHSILETGAFSLPERLSFASFGYIEYFIKMVLPVRLSALYPYPDRVHGSIPGFYYIFPFIAIFGTLGIIYAFRKSPLSLFGFLFFIANIVFVLQIMPVGDAYMADRYCYIPSIGFFLIIACYCSSIPDKMKAWKIPMRILIAFYCVIIAFMTFQRIGIWKNSIILWNDVLSKYTNNSKVWNNRGVAYSLEKKYQDAMNDYTMALKIKPDLHEGWLNRADARKFLKDYAGSLADYNQLAILDPNNADIYNNRGVLKSETGDYLGAIADFDKALHLNKKHAVAMNNRADAKIKIHDFNGAIDDCNNAIGLNPDYAEAFNNRGTAEKELKDFPQALNDFNRAIKHNPQYADAYYNRGNLNSETGKIKEANEDFDKANSLGKEEGGAYIAKGLLLMGQNDNAGAMANFNKGLSLEPSFAGYMNRGVLQSKMGAYAEAINDYDKAIEMEPKSSLAFMNRCNAEIQIKGFTDALADVNKSIQLDPSNGIAFINRGIIEVNLGEYKSAISDFDLVLRTNKHPFAYYYRGVAKIKTGLKQDGCQDIREAKKLGFTDVDKSLELVCN